MLAKVLTYIGIALVFLGVAALSPLMDLLPIEFASNPLSLFNKPNSGTYYRVVQSEQSPWPALLCILIGLATYLGGRVLANRA